MTNKVANYRLAIITSQFNEPVTSSLKEGAHQRLLELGCQASNLSHFSVPGAIEIGLIAKKLAKQACYDAIITLGAVIRGETAHFDYVCQQVSDATQQVMMAYELPVVFGILTTDNVDQAKDRIGGAHGHKGKEAAETAIEMIQLLHALEG